MLWPLLICYGFWHLGCCLIGIRALHEFRTIKKERAHGKIRVGSEKAQDVSTLSEEELLCWSRTDLDSTNQAWVFLCLISIAPIRFFLGVSIVLLFAATAFILRLCYKRFPDRGNEYGKIVRVLTSFCAYLAVAAIGYRIEEMSLSSCGGIKKVLPEVNRDDLLVTCVSNHVSYIDAAVLTATLQPAFVAKQAIMDLPLIGAICKDLQSVFVERHCSESRERTLRKITQRQSELLEQRTKWVENKEEDSIVHLQPLLVFAEGTTTNGQHLLPFRRGAFMHEEGFITPLLIKYETPNGVVSPAYHSLQGLNLAVLSLAKFGQGTATIFWMTPKKRMDSESTNDFILRVRTKMLAGLKAIHR